MIQRNILKRNHWEIYAENEKKVKKISKQCGLIKKIKIILLFPRKLESALRNSKILDSSIKLL